MNVGDLLNLKGVTWGWFQGGFRSTGLDKTGAPTSNTCAVAHADMAGVVSADYIPHHEPFQYYPSTANPQHLPPLSVSAVGSTDQANHQYDLSDFWGALKVGNLPSVSFLKAPGYEDGHAGYSDPLDEQAFVVDTVNKLERSPFWKSTAVVIAYDDSDGWYDHVSSPIVNQSQDPSQDLLANTDTCGTHSDAAHVLGMFQDRCGYGPRLPLLVISPWAKRNYVDHTTTDQTSILRFIETNWETGAIGNFSFDEKSGPLDNMFAFDAVGPVDAALAADPRPGHRQPEALDTIAAGRRASVRRPVRSADSRVGCGTPRRSPARTARLPCRSLSRTSYLSPAAAATFRTTRAPALGGCSTRR